MSLPGQAPTADGSNNAGTPSQQTGETKLVVVFSSTKIEANKPAESDCTESESESICASSHSSSSAASERSDRKVSVDTQQRDSHDIFNLVVLPLLLAAIIVSWDFASWMRGETTLQESCNHKQMSQLIGTTLLYFTLDLIWVAMTPNCVKSPKTILVHHMVTLFYAVGPLLYPEYGYFMAPILSIELNTWFLILRRVLFLRKDSPHVPELLRQIVDYAFYLSWILVRVLAQNAILIAMLTGLAERHQSNQDTFLPGLFVGNQVVLNVMSLKWTYDLFKPLIINPTRFGWHSESGKEHTL